MKITEIERVPWLRLEMVEREGMLYYRVIHNHTGYIQYQGKDYHFVRDWMYQEERKYSQNSYK